ncbi:hypothetical protein DM860_014794 [Cuscuta australis]|uniref:EF-hand domain-containing protein n=1 Tax=Cuscuta australis TaxID=267555 RepID=A0A328D311_9ASTE|nr:hypothetical protein DM860_014794 [Cuscuta australis]
MRSLGRSLSEAELEEMIKEADTDGSGTVDFNEFIELMASKNDNNGHITVDELHHVMHNLNQKLNDAEVEELMKEANVDNNGVIDYQQFVNVIMSRLGHYTLTNSSTRSTEELGKQRPEPKRGKITLQQFGIKIVSSMP